MFAALIIACLVGLIAGTIIGANSPLTVKRLRRKIEAEIEARLRGQGGSS